MAPTTRPWISAERDNGDDPATSTASVTRGLVVHPSLLEALFERYLDWKEACFEVAQAYARWQHSPHSDRASAFTAYEASLDLEQSASSGKDSFARVS